MEKTVALEYIRRLKAELIVNDRQTYYQFSQTLKQFRRGNILPSTAVAIVQKLLRNHPDLLHDFKPFTPINHSATAVEEDSDLKACLAFVKRVRTRFPDDGVYRKFLECLNPLLRGETTVSEVCDKVSGLFRKHPDLAAEFQSFVPESYIQQSCQKKRKVDQVSLQPRKKKTTSRRKSGTSTEQERSIGNNQATDFSMEDSLCEVDVEIGNLAATYEKAGRLMRRLSDGRLSVCIEEHFTPLNLACIRRLDKKLLNNANPASAMPDLMKKLEKKKEGLEKSRVRIVEKWNRIRTTIIQT